MTRKDYQAVARLLGAVGGESDENAKVCATVTAKLADYFQQENPRFDRGRFYNEFSVSRSLSASLEWGN
jgi:hypothetical protein